MERASFEVRIGVIGTGHMGRYHLNVLSTLENATIVGVHDTDQGRLQDAASRFGCVAFPGIDPLLEAVDAVCIAVPTAFHETVAMRALDAGVHVLLEKPIAPTLEAADRIISRASAAGLVLHIGHVERFNGAIRQIRSVLDGPLLLEARRLSPPPGRTLDAGVVLDLMIHDLDIVLFLLNDEVAEIRATGGAFDEDGHENVANALLRFRSGCLAVLTASRITQEKIRTLSVSQPSGYISLDYTTQEINIHRQVGQEFRLENSEIRYSVASTTERVFVHSVNPLRKELAHFIRCVAGVEDSIVGNDQDLKALETALAVTGLIRRTSDG